MSNNFNPSYRQGSRQAFNPRIPAPGSSLDRPMLYVPDCDPSEQAKACAALEAIQAARPLKPPGKRC